MENQIVYATALDAVLIRLADTTKACEEALLIHPAEDSAAKGLCRTLTAAVLGASLMKNDSDLFTVTVDALGPISKITASANPNGEVRALIDLNSSMRQTDLKNSLQEGSLTILKEDGFGEPYRGSIPIISGDIAQDLTAYFAVSEQTPTSCGLNEQIEERKVMRSVGFLVQLLPDTPDYVIDLLEEDLRADQDFLRLFEDYDDPNELLVHLFPNLTAKISQTKSVRFQCSCSREKAEKALISTGQENLSEMIQENHDFPVVCPYCQTNYSFSPEELKELLLEAKK